VPQKISVIAPIKTGARYPFSQDISRNEQGWFIKAQTHLNYDGSELYVGVLKEKLETIP
jgi:hypothetical protein